MNEMDMRLEKIEKRLSELGALASLIHDEMANSQHSAVLAQKQIQKLQVEIEQLYIVMKEPLVITKE